MAILSVWVISKSGGLVWQKDFSQLAGESVPFCLPRLSTNDYLVFASTFQSIHAITTQLDPMGEKCSGIQTLDWKGFNFPFLLDESASNAIAPSLSSATTTPTPSPTTTTSPASLSSPFLAASPPFRLTCFQSPTGLKLLLLSSPRQPQLDFIMKRLYEVYADYVMKNPFHTPEMPIRSERFDVAVGKVVEQMTSSTY